MVQLNREDWEAIKKQVTHALKDAMVSVEINTLLTELAEKNIAKYPPKEQTKLDDKKDE